MSDWWSSAGEVFQSHTVDRRQSGPATTKLSPSRPYRVRPRYTIMYDGLAYRASGFSVRWPRYVINPLSSTSASRRINNVPETVRNKACRKSEDGLIVWVCLTRNNGSCTVVVGCVSDQCMFVPGYCVWHRRWPAVSPHGSVLRVPSSPSTHSDKTNEYYYLMRRHRISIGKPGAPWLLRLALASQSKILVMIVERARRLNDVTHHLTQPSNVDSCSIASCYCCPIDRCGHCIRDHPIKVTAADCWHKRTSPGCGGLTQAKPLFLGQTLYFSAAKNEEKNFCYLY